MKRIISALLMVLLLLSGCKKAEDGIVNDSLVKDTSQTVPETVRTEAPKTDEASVSVPVKSKTDKQSERKKLKTTEFTWKELNDSYPE